MDIVDFFKAAACMTTGPAIMCTAVAAGVAGLGAGMVGGGMVAQSLWGDNPGNFLIGELPGLAVATVPSALVTVGLGKLGLKILDLAY
jgi:hypothetical protein